MTSPDISALVGRLEYWGDHFETSWAKACKEAAQALRALEAERDEAQKYWRLYFDECIESDVQRKSLQHEVNRLKVLVDHYEKAVGWIATSESGGTIHFAKADGWTVEPVLQREQGETDGRNKDSLEPGRSNSSS